MKEKNEIKLRGHHLVCLNFFSGEGYDEEFITNLTKVVYELENGVSIRIITGGDDICKKCPNLKENKCYYKEDSDEGIRKMDKVALELLELKKNKKIRWYDIKLKIPGVLPEWKNLFCNSCEWKYVCEKNPRY